MLGRTPEKMPRKMFHYMETILEHLERMPEWQLDEMPENMAECQNTCKKNCQNMIIYAQ